MRPDGLGATIMPHGVLYRGAKEKEIRTGIIKADRLEAVIGLAPNMFYGTDIPAYVLVLRGTAPRPVARRGKILFINADREFTAGRAQNYLGPQHAEKIVAAYHAWRDIPGFARVVDISELAYNDFNLNIRRYVDNTPPAEPQDVRAHLYGGVPKAEVSAHAGRFAAYGIDVHSLFTERDSSYYDFPLGGTQRVVDQIPELVASKEAELWEAFDDWWNRHVKHIIELPDTKRVMDARADLLDSFVTAMEPLGILDRFQLAGVIASWWGGVQYDMRTLAFHDFSDVVQGWLTTIEAAFAEDEDEDLKIRQNRSTEKRRAREHRVVPLLIPDYMNALQKAEASQAKMEAQVKAAAGGEDADPGQTLSPDDAKELKANISAAKRQMKQLEAEFVSQLSQSAVKLDDEAKELLVLRIIKSDLKERLDAQVAAGRRSLADCYWKWSDKYAVGLRDLETRCDFANQRFNAYLQELGYA